MADEPLVDRTLNCVDCHNDFSFTVGEQQFFRDKGLKNEPKRCKPCKQQKAARFDQMPPKVNLEPGQRFEIVCDQCGRKDTVPFVPSKGKPVYCGDCFSARRAAQPVAS